MPPKKRALAEADPNLPATPGRGKKSKKSGQQKEKSLESNQVSNGNDSQTSSGKKDEELSTQHLPFEYYCIPRPFSDLEEENRQRDEDLVVSNHQLTDEYNKYVDKFGRQIDKRAVDMPNHEWVCMWNSFKMLQDNRRFVTYTDPDNFGMYIYNDFHGYGVQELLENFLNAFNNEFKKKANDGNSVKQAWATLAALIHWLSQDEVWGPWSGQDDGDRVKDSFKLVGRAFLSGLNELDRAGLLRADSEIKDLGLVMAIGIEWSGPMADYGIEVEEDFDWRKNVVAYAKKADIDLEDVGLYGIKRALEQLGAEHGTINSLEGTIKADRWSWKKNFKEYGDKHGKIGGDSYNILKMSRKERARYAFDKKDPLADFPEKDLREGNIMLAG